jgi:hypothetical protein
MDIFQNAEASQVADDPAKRPGQPPAMHPIMTPE